MENFTMVCYGLKITEIETAILGYLNEDKEAENSSIPNEPEAIQ